MGEQLHLNLSVEQCPGCGGSHASVHFTPGDGPSAGETHWTVCPTTGAKWWMDTRVHPGVWERLLKAAGL